MKYNKTSIRMRKIRLLVYTFTLTLLSALFLSGCSKEKIPYSKTDFYFDTVITLTVYETSDNEQRAEELLTEAMAICQKYENLLSPTKEGSDIYNINHAGGEAVMVSEETSNLIYTALNYCDLSDGSIDISIAPVKNLWNFNPETNSGSIPSDIMIKNTLPLVNYKNIEIKGNSIKLSDPSAAIDLGFIAKGFIADQIKSYLLSQKVDHALINLGGNILTVGSKPDKLPFKIGIQEPFAEAGTYITTVDCGDNLDSCYASVVTSGIYERCFTVNDEIYHHILNPRTGYPVKTDLYSVTILTDSSTQADALSTTCLVLGLEKGMALIESLDEVDAIFITSTMEIVDTRDS